MATIELIDISHAYTPGTYAIQNINLTWQNGVSSALLGPSGCGKTTLLKIISGLLIPSEGKVLLNGKDVTKKSPQARNVAQVFQFPVVYETLNVFDNLAFPLRNRKISEKQVKLRVNEIAELLDLQTVLKKNANQLGADEKQRVSLGRGIVRQDISAILLDEPLTVIDPTEKWHLRRKLKELHQQLGFTMIYVTHDQHEALTFADQVTVMNTGIALQTGSPQALHGQPEAPFVGYFIGSPGMNIFPATLQGDTIQVGDLILPLSVPSNIDLSNCELKVGIRPEFIKTSSNIELDYFVSTITAVHLTGNALIVDLQGGGLNFKARLDEDAAVEVGQHLWVSFPKEWLMLYADDRAVKLNKRETVA